MVSKALRWLRKWLDKSIRPVAYLCLLVAFGAELWLIFGASIVTQRTYLTPITILFSALTATCGWLWSGHINRRLARRTQAVNLLMAIRSKEVNDWKVAVYDYIENQGQKDKPRPLNEVQKLLGIYEFLAICVMNGTVDESMIDQSQRYVFLRLYKGLDSYISKAIEADSENYCHFIACTKKWNKDAFTASKPKYISPDSEF